MVDFEAIIEKGFRDSENNISLLARDSNVKKALSDCAQVIINCYNNGGCLFVAGNGGSAADSQHLVAELVSKLSKNRTPIRAFAMTVDSSILTAVGNDYGFDLVFERQVRGLMKPEDAFLGITTSGNSKNMIRAFQACREIRAKSILLTGGTGGECLSLADHAIRVPASLTHHIQEAHIIVYHTLCYLVELGLVESGQCKYT